MLLWRTVDSGRVGSVLFAFDELRTDATVTTVGWSVHNSERA